MDGVLVIDKGSGMTSHDVVQRVRKLFRTSKVGHIGTLDPMATGVLPLCIGSATRIARFFPTSSKEYTGEIRFGFSTNTYDREGTPTSAEQPLSSTREEVAAAMKAFIGSLDQLPPPFSAKKIGGIASHKLARRGEAVEVRPVRVEVEAFDLLEFHPPLARFRVICGGGTYIRSLAHDLGTRLGCGAHLESLRRLTSSGFGVDQAVSLDEASEKDVVAVEKLLPDLPCIVIEDSDEKKVAHGVAVAAAEPAGWSRIFNKQGQFLAVACVESGWAHPRVVLTSKA
jgi:tRNA pseudouridine55 synthase